MSCTRHFLNVQWESHSWHPRVTFAENVATHETNLWGRVVNGECVRCQKQDFCDMCGMTRRNVSCLCDTVRGEHCAIRLAWIDKSRHATQ